MLDLTGRRYPPDPASGPPLDRPDLMDWLTSGRLTLIDQSKQALPPEDWEGLPAHVRSRALEDFARVVRGSAKAAVIFLRE